MLLAAVFGRPELRRAQVVLLAQVFTQLRGRSER